MLSDNTSHAKLSVQVYVGWMGFRCLGISLVGYHACLLACLLRYKCMLTLTSTSNAQITKLTTEVLNSIEMSDTFDRAVKALNFVRIFIGHPGSASVSMLAVVSISTYSWLVCSGTVLLSRSVLFTAEKCNFALCCVQIFSPFKRPRLV